MGERVTFDSKAHTFHTYPATSHAFLDEDGPDVSVAPAASDARTRALARFRRELKR